jgi:hypothetical protein
MNTVRFNCVIGSTDFSVPLGLEVWLDQYCFFDQDHIDQIYQVEHEISDNDGDHELRFVLKNKLPDHTRVDVEGNILSDAMVTVRDIQFDGINCQYLTTNLAEYQHDFNGSQSPTVDKFYGTMGCNGTVSLKFTTPIYIWLLENM